MFSLQDLLGQKDSSAAVGQISANLGADPATVNSAVQMALPVILSGLANNAKSAEGAQNLDSALAKDHSGGLLSNLSDFLTGGVPAPTEATRETNGSGILGHILGSNQTTAAQEISNRTGLNAGQAANLLITLAPIVMAYLGKEKRESNLNAGGISDLLTGKTKEMKSSGNPMIDLASKMLDSDGDGSVVDDLASMAAGYFMK